MCYWSTLWEFKWQHYQSATKPGPKHYPLQGCRFMSDTSSNMQTNKQLLIFKLTLKVGFKTGCESVKIRFAIFLCFACQVHLRALHCPLSLVKTKASWVSQVEMLKCPIHAYHYADDNLVLYWMPKSNHKIVIYKRIKCGLVSAVFILWILKC